MINLSVKMPKLNLDKESDDKTNLSNLIKYDPEFRQLLESSNYKRLYSYVDKMPVDEFINIKGKPEIV